MKNLKISEGGLRSLKSSQRNAFTLAEVLITLAIIGIVAALTIPTVVAKFQQRELYTRFIETYNIFANVFVQLKAEGLIDTDDQGSDMPSYVLEKLKYSVQCEYGDIECFGGKQFIYYNNLPKGLPDARSFYYMNTLYALPNGANFTIGYIQGVTNYVGFNIDTNGIHKGPNVIGRDYFELSFFPYQTSPSFCELVYTNLESDIANKKQLTNYSTWDCSSNADSNYAGSGLSCGLRLLLEGKMDY